MYAAVFPPFAVPSSFKPAGAAEYPHRQTTLKSPDS
jgi:hypothetical protein